ncbi:hypothetical protein RV11_GL001529 [Enterococcus phoeniculicola]|jgi:2-iminobutanoate/2-iminopropanoate deaminase|uniref:Uncharacterized protein n=1 Tax=Enterococcus phoeniculicola ATCC BAA-412 TaxID=1158610 RepID=R3W339_9ENTE|nr:Rid family detoxifying hydrolase [Enterococcus phoeniculicola]EOL41866.1 hypothetical protein UC3_02214 [Enterococcus phoeniculicola ATCC BAA-412]EOT79855.1 hypothetical protein I589_01367 [Enterococcus phoeniculicola ATCC BAA-412]OJG70256.1 hypothetical protein RV11_GL001529 [Enterococcus phoeniculicola]
MKKIIQSPKLSAAGPYSHGIETDGSILFFSGQLGIDPATGKMGETIQEQTVFAIKNIEILLEEANLTKEAVVKTTVFLKDIADFPIMNQLYGEYFSSLPARSAFQVAALPNDGLIEIEIIATR